MMEVAKFSKRKNYKFLTQSPMELLWYDPGRIYSYHVGWQESIM